MPKNHLLSRAEAAAYCGLAEVTLRKAERTGSLVPSGHVGRTPYYSPAHLDEWRARIRRERAAQLHELHTHTRRYRAKNGLENKRKKANLKLFKRLDNGSTA